jgi:glutamate synthase domain-containing protein 3
VVPELRDYQQINAELSRRLERGQAHVRLEGVEGQRLLVLGLSGPWHAVVEIDGNAGPELAAELDAPGLTVVCRGSAGDGAGRGLSAGSLVILGPAGTALGYGQEGGLIVATRPVGPRAGLRQRGGNLVLLDRCGPLAGELLAGGRLFVRQDLAGPLLGSGAAGGRIVPFREAVPTDPTMDREDQRTIEAAAELAARFGRRD